jgi:hypothetical protein
MSDLENEKVSSETKGLDDLFQSLEQACDRLRHLLKSREPGRYVTSRS